MYRTFKHFIVTVFLLLIVLTINAQDEILLHAEFSEINIGNKIQILEDSDKSIAFDDIISGKYENNFQNSTREIPFFDYQNKSYWIRFTLQNQSERTTNPILLIYRKKVNGL